MRFLPGGVTYIKKFRNEENDMEKKQFLGFSANTLKGVAMLTMFIDHLAYLAAPNRGLLYAVLHFIGSVTAPILFYFVTVGYHHTCNVNKYTIRLGLFALISYVPFIYFFDAHIPNTDNFLNLNVIYTLLLGLLALRVKHEMKSPFLKFPLLAMLILLSAFGDWGYMGLLMIFAFDFFYGDYKSQRFAYLLLLLTEFIPMVLKPILTIRLGATPDFSIYWFAIARAGGFIPIFLLAHYNGNIGRGGRIAKWSFYIFYPLHLVLLSLLRFFM